MWDRPAQGWSMSTSLVVAVAVAVAAVRVRRLREVEPTVVPSAGPRDRAAVEEVATNSASATPVVVVAAAGRRQVVVGVAAALLPRSVAGPARSGGRSCDVAPHHSGTLPCLRLGNSSRLVASMRRPATNFWRVSAGSITSSM